MLKLQDRFPVELRLHRFILCTRRSGGAANEGGGCDQSIGSTVTPLSVTLHFSPAPSLLRVLQLNASHPGDYFSTPMSTNQNLELCLCARTQVSVGCAPVIRGHFGRDPRALRQGSEGT